MRRELIGETLLNQFRVENFIAAGGMATIYRVWDLQRSVPLAMKVLNPELAEEPAFISRFEREARSLQALVHPHIVPFYGLYRAGDLTFLLERYIDGPSLEEVLRRRAGRPLPLKDALTYFKALYTSLGYAHAQGIIHCDIKPGNVLIDQGGHVYLTDFGIARYADVTTTTTALVMGTPLYMAPEQIRGERATRQTDIYSLGVLMFELLTGQRPFRGDVGVPPGIGENASDRIRYQHLNLPPPNPRGFNPNLPEGLARVLLKAMDKNPAQRYDTVQAMANDIAQVVMARFETLPDRVNWEDEVQPAASAAEVAAADAAAYDAAAAYPYNGPVIPAGPAWKPAANPPMDDLPHTLPAIPPDVRPAPAPNRLRRRWLPVAIGTLLVLFLCALIGTQLVRAFRQGGLANLPAGLPSPSHLPSTAATLPGKSASPSAKPTDTRQSQPTAVPATQTPALHATAPAAPASFDTGDFQVAGTFALVVHQNGGERLFMLDTASGQLAQMPAVPNVNQRSLNAVQWSPDGQRVTYIAEYNNRLHVVVMDITEKEPYQLAAGEAFGHVSSPAFLPDGKRVSFWASGGGVNAMVIADAITGKQIDQVDLPVYRNMFTWNWQTSQLAFVQQRPDGVYQVVISKSATGSDYVINQDGEGYAPTWSNDGQWIAYQSNQGKSSPADSDIWIAKPDGSQARQITHCPVGGWCRGPSWSPDGKQIAFVSNAGGSLMGDMGELYVIEISSGKVRQLTHTGGAVYDWRLAWRPK